MVDKAALQIGYAKTAKKVDMKRIKAVTWAILTQASSEVNSSTLLIYSVLEDYLPAVFFFRDRIYIYLIGLILPSVDSNLGFFSA